MNANLMLIWSLVLLAVATLLMGVGVAVRVHRREQAEQRVSEALESRSDTLAWRPSDPYGQDDSEGESAQETFTVPGHWLSGRLGQALLAEEDRKLIDISGLEAARGQSVFFLSRVALGLVLPLLALFLFRGDKWTTLALAVFVGLALGVMIPKWVLRSRVAQRREQVKQELPLFIDLLRLLQGVGLSIDQTLQVLAAEFHAVLRVMGRELAIANAQYANGRTRAQSLRRLTLVSDSDDIRALIALLAQVDRHGGAVQEPLKQFSLRLREARQAQFKEKIGKITVKMTGVMVLTLLPALIVITAGPGFVAVFRALGSMGGAR
ncbi:MAG: type II secretion system F family protein [Comamonas sp.]